MAPALLLAAGFSLWPIGASLAYSFLDWSGFGGRWRWIGLDNYRELLGDRYFWAAFRRSFLVLLFSVPPRLLGALLVALLLHGGVVRLAALLRVLFFLPAVTTTAIVGIMMTFILSPANGPLNRLLLASGIIARPLDFLGDPRLALGTIAAVFTWKGFGLTVIYWLAALQTIPQPLVEAARIDGAGPWAVVRHITLPLLLPFALLITIITAVQTLRIFPLVQTMTGGGPFFASEVVEVYIYRTAFGGGVPRLGYASAAAVFFGLALLLLALAQGRAGASLRARRDAAALGAAGGR